MMNKPDVDSIEGLSPAISIEQKTTQKKSKEYCRNCHGNLRLPKSAIC